MIHIFYSSIFSVQGDEVAGQADSESQSERIFEENKNETRIRIGEE